MVSIDAASGNSSPPTFITCHAGSTPGSGPTVHPRQCFVNGWARQDEVWVAVLVDLHWHHWGAGRALARGFALNPDTNKRSPIRVAAYAKVSCGMTGSSYTKLRLAGGEGGVLTLHLAFCEPRG